MLNDARMKPFRYPPHSLPVQGRAGIAEPSGSSNQPGQPWRGQAPFPVRDTILANLFDLRIDQDSQWNWTVSRSLWRIRIVGPLLWNPKHDQAERNVHLRCRKPNAWRIVHRLDHVRRQSCKIIRGEIGNRVRAPQQHRASHSGNLQNSHAPIYIDGTNLSGVA